MSSGSEHGLRSIQHRHNKVLLSHSFAEYGNLVYSYNQSTPKMCILVHREGKHVCQMPMLISTAAASSRNAHWLEYVQIPELKGHIRNIF